MSANIVLGAHPLLTSITPAVPLSGNKHRWVHPPRTDNRTHGDFMRRFPACAAFQWCAARACTFFNGAFPFVALLPPVLLAFLRA
jgi:hypothetical protein